MDAYGRVDDRLIAAITAVVGSERVSTTSAIREAHGRDESYYDDLPPDLVAFPKSTDEVAAIVAACAARRVPVIPFGAGTSLEGHVAAVHGGVCLDLLGMDRVIALHAEDMDVVVEPGITRTRLDAHLRDTGLFFPVDPGADATLGGMVATRASGTNAVRYGTMRENVLGLTVVMADGQVVKTGGRARKSAAGYDLTRLFVGSEGTLGVITEITLRLQGVPEAVSAAVCPFPSVGSAVDAVIETIQSGIPVARIEFLDARSMAAVAAYGGLAYAARPTLFFEFHGSPGGVAEQAAAVGAIAADHGGGGFDWATRQEDRDRLWHARHNAYYAARAQHPDTKGVVGDVCVPISRLAEAIGRAEDLLGAASIPAYIVGHVGDGNFHTLFLVDPARPEQMAEAKRLNARLVELALSMDGTCTGEHGIGFGKKGYMEAEHGAPAIKAMAAIKHALDPMNLMNPGKTVPELR